MTTHQAPAAPAAASPEVFQQLGHITRQLHDGMSQLGVLLALRDCTDSLPDARSRMHFIVRKTGEAADKVLTAVESAKQECAALTGAVRGASDGGAPVPADIAATVERSVATIDARLTDIMLAQDFHDLTGQVAAKVVALATSLEDSLLKLLLSTAACEGETTAAPESLQGPVVPDVGRAEVVQNQREVDDLLASLGF